MFRIPAARRITNLSVAQRRYTSSLKEGAVAQSKGAFQTKEKAVENQYAHNIEVQQLEKLKAELEAQKKKLSESEATLDNLIQKANGKSQ
ncbi:uncharacterized protein EV420DRAFT_1639161 [Desarmillaria tabescens]|uniref:ATPase inhibitor, mitochondrial n=1 Tax=Armillaria tabescens TaxID=1929756 RepID=A0AA39NCP3_ARMTA|nr:uncharacterized protein EV420DRAFT_1639161 [Desarmillaria tabescens]KAK0463073.1 hypothetical protein EV420DRAFT_1639161 [Desarmillaria tabescens]